MRIVRALLLGALLLLGLDGALAQERSLAPRTGTQPAPRVALAIGIDGYERVARLRKAVSDAQGISRALADLGFAREAVGLVLDPDRAAMTRALAEWIVAAKDAEVAFLFFAGHGVELEGSNYLLPRDVPPVVASASGEIMLRNSAISLDWLLRELRAAGPRAAVIVLDACRDNPFADGRGRTVGGRAGLANVQVPDGIVIAYSAGAHQTALDRLGDDDPHPNSVFTRVFLKHLGTAGLSVQDIVRRTGLEVRELTRRAAGGHEQTPAYYDQILRDVVLRPAEPAGPVAGTGFDARAIELAWWRAFEQSGDPADLRAYLEKYPSGEFAPLARNRLAALEAVRPPAPPAPAPEPTAERVPPPAPEPVARPAAASPAEPGRRFRDCPGCPEMVVVPAGRFEMGSTEAERRWVVEQGGTLAWTEDEQPRHPVAIASPFALGRLEVTRGELARFVAATGHRIEPGCHVFTGTSWRWDPERTWRDPGFAQDDGHPAVCVSFDDATAYAAWLARETGRPYRLPSEAEWEYAARGSRTPSPAVRYWGDDPEGSEACLYANGADQSAATLLPGRALLRCRDGAAYTAVAGRYRPNAFGLHDMLGNAWEWVADCYRAGYADAPADGSARIEAGSCATRVLRGASFAILPRSLRAAFRVRYEPQARYQSIGFRVARALVEGDR